MTRLLVDTSVWVEHLRDTGSTAALELRRLLGEPSSRIVCTPTITMELLAGATSDAALLALTHLTDGLESLALDPAVDVHTAASVFRAARQRGQAVRGLVDCLLAAIAWRHGVTLVHSDADLARAAGALSGLQTLDLR